MYELFGGNPFDLMAEVLRLADAYIGAVATLARSFSDTVSGK